MILVCGTAADPSIGLVLAQLRASRHAYRFVELSRFPAGYSATWTWDQTLPHGTISGPGWELHLDDITSVFIRYARPSECRSDAATLEPVLQQAASVEAQAGLALLLHQLPCRVVNRYDSGMANSSKPYQSIAIQSAGFQVPVSLVTTDPVRARAFRDGCAGGVVIKPLSGLSAVVRFFEESDLERLAADEPHTPVYLQTYIEGHNIRVHVVGDELFATLCTSNVVDYRYASVQGGLLRLEPTRLPDRVASACRRLSESAGLLLSGIDLKRTPQGEYYCLEVNPFPVFAWYEQQTGQAISAAVVHLLAGETQSSFVEVRA